jgi:hypothetical protein
MKKAGPDQTPASRLVFVKPEQENPLGTTGLEGRMGDAPDMPELEHHAAATGIDCTGHAFPACDLLGAVDTRRADIALALGRDLGFSEMMSPALARWA